MEAAHPSKRLETWRQISDFIGKDLRTAKRWESDRGMPVHRVPGEGKSAVFAFTDELERWLARGRGEPASSPAAPATPPGAGVSSPGAQLVRPPPRLSISPWALAAGLAAVCALVVSATVLISNARPGAHRPAPQAVALYRQGRYEWTRRTPESLRAALSLFTRAAARDPQYADAFVGMADSYNLLREYSGMPDDEAYPRAERAARQALALDPDSASAHAALAFVEFYWDWNVAAARRDFERAIALDPRSASAHHWYATALSMLGDHKAALAQIDAAEALSPDSPAVHADKGLILINAGRMAEAETLLKSMAQSEPRFLSSRYYLSYLYGLQGRYPEHISELKAVADLKQDETSRRIAEASEAGFRAGGPRQMLAARLKAEETLYAEGRLSEFQLAIAAAEAGQDQAAIEHLRAAAVRHDPNVLAARSMAVFARIRARPEFAAALAAAPAGA